MVFNYLRSQFLINEIEIIDYFENSIYSIWENGFYTKKPVENIPITIGMRLLNKEKNK